jgi:hypothetical protein
MTTVTPIQINVTVDDWYELINDCEKAIAVVDTELDKKLQLKTVKKSKNNLKKLRV